MSQRFTLNAEDGWKIVKGFAVVVVGAAVTHGTKILTGHDFGTYTPLVVAGWATVVNVLRKWLGGPPGA